MSTLVTNTITGLSTAANITIGSTPVVSASANSLTVRGEGSNQTSVQQGLAKCFCHYTTAGTFVNNSSFNTASLTDGGAGDCRVNFTNNMGSADGYSATRTSNTFHTLDSEDNAGYAKTITYNSSNAAEDASRTQVTVHGDLT